MDKYFLRISDLYSFVQIELAITIRMASWGTWNSRRAALRLVFGRIPGLS